jgi:hypothetical protein
MAGDQWISFFIGLLFLVLYFVSTRPKKKQPDSHAERTEMRGQEVLPQRRSKQPLQRMPPSMPLSSQSLSEESSTPLKNPLWTQTNAPAYEVEKKKCLSPLAKDWKRKKSLRQAFILSEVLKRPYEY